MSQTRPGVNTSLTSILAAIARLRPIAERDPARVNADTELREELSDLDQSLWELVGRAEKDHPVVVYRVVGQAQGLIWTGTDRLRAEEQAVMAAVNTGRTVYLSDGEPDPERVLPPRAARR